MHVLVMYIYTLIVFHSLRLKYMRQQMVEMSCLVLQTTLLQKKK